MGKSTLPTRCVSNNTASVLLVCIRWDPRVCSGADGFCHALNRLVCTHSFRKCSAYAYLYILSCRTPKRPLPF